MRNEMICMKDEKTQAGRRWNGLPQKAGYCGGPGRLKKSADVIETIELRASFEEFDEDVGHDVLGLGLAPRETLDVEDQRFRIAEKERISRPAVPVLKGD
jgi:hypothetical protein